MTMMARKRSSMRLTISMLVVLLAETTTATDTGLTRRLAVQEPFLFYNPLSTVTDHAAIDLDQQALESALSRQEFAQAQDIYEQGGYSQSYARLTLTEPLQTQVLKGTNANGRDDDVWVLGKVLELAPVNATTLLVEYHSSPRQADVKRSCHVGALPEPITEGCFDASGSIEIENHGLYSYTYEPATDNNNQRTLQSFSTNAKELMWDCQFGASHSNCPYPTYSKFYQYYGVYSYGDHWIEAVFQKKATQFSNGNADFSNYSNAGRAEAIKRATIQMNLWMMVIREMEHAIEICQYTQDEDDHLYSWDKAVAYYIGSVTKQAQGQNYEGYSLYTLAEERCMSANTCLPESQLHNDFDHVGSMAQVNQDVLKNFKLGQSVLMERHCEAARTMSRRIMTDMMVPLIQGVLRYAYQMDVHVDDVNEVVGHDLEAEGSVFAASILPLLHSCSVPDAAMLHRHMGVGSGQDANYKTVRAILEQNYQCLGLTCEDIGGIANVKLPPGSYMEGGEPCGVKPTLDDKPTEIGTTKPVNGNDNSGNNGSSTTLTSFGPNVGMAVGLVIAIVVAGLLVTVLLSRGKYNEQQKDYDNGPAMT